MRFMVLVKSALEATAGASRYNRTRRAYGSLSVPVPRNS